MSIYDPKKIEDRWQRYWEERGMYRAGDFSEKPKQYILDMFPYPSGEGLHVGHPLGYIATDVCSRYFRMRGFNVLHPMGWDAFGLPAENYAIQNRIHPKVAVAQNIARFKKQLGQFGFSYDWTREINTTDPSYYKWTQWIFLQLFKRGLAYQADVSVNFCPRDKTGLANEEVVDGKCERCGMKVERRVMRQWMLKITDYADRLLEDLEALDWPERIKEMQRNWIGRSEGVEVNFALKDLGVSKVLLATNNPSKIQRVRQLIEHVQPAVEVILLEQAGIAAAEVQEGDDLYVNAEVKARAYAEKANLPVLGMDSGLFLDGVNQDPARVKRSALNGEDEKSLSQDEIGKRMFAYYRELASKRGGKIPGYYLDVFALVTPDGSVRKTEARRDLVLTDTPHGSIDYHFPIRSLYVLTATGKYAAEQTKKEELIKELEPYARALREILQPSIRVFTTRPDTLFGATYVVVAPEHPLLKEISKLKAQIPNLDDVAAYVEEAKRKSELERQEGKEKTGVRIEGIAAVNPVNGEEVPVFVADYVLGHYGTGAIMAVPAHDERDFSFARTHQLPIREVVTPDGKQRTQIDVAYVDDGTLVNSGSFSGLRGAEARQRITAWLVERGMGRALVTYRLRDWIFSRQRFWGEPIPLVFCRDCKTQAEMAKSQIPNPKKNPNLKSQISNSQFSKGELLNPGWVAVPEEELPVTLPNVERYESTGTGESPLAAIKEWVETACPKCSGAAKRETNTMPQWAGSCWYYLRFLDPHNTERLVDEKKEKYWLPVDLYLGGAEHAVLHLLYARFWHKVLFDAGYVSTSEPFRKLFNQGMILGPDHQKMSKSRGNVINPDEVIDHYGADTLRLYEMFMGPLETEKPWDTRGIVGLWRFLNKVYNFVVQNHAELSAEQRKHPTRIDADQNADQRGSIRENPRMGPRESADAMERLRHRVIKKVTEDIEAMKFNTAISALMEYTSEITKSKIQSPKYCETLMLLLAPFAPHITEELWQEVLKREESVHEQPWPAHDPALIEEEMVTVVIQVNGRTRGSVSVRRGSVEAEVAQAARNAPAITKHLEGIIIQRTVFVPDRLLNFVVAVKP